MSSAAISILLTILVCVTVPLFRKTSDPYGTFHVGLNRVPGGPNPPKTEWLNMGYWKVPTIPFLPSLFR